MRKRRKRRRIKYNNIIKMFIFIMIVIFILIFNPLSIKKDSLKIEKKKDIVERVYKNINKEEVSNDFLEWVYDTYGKDKFIKLENSVKDSYSDKIWHDIYKYSYIVLMDMYNDKYKDINHAKVIDNDNNNTISFVGDVSLADNWYIMPEYDKRGKKVYGILSEDTVKVMTESAIMVVNNEFTVSNRGEKMPGKYYTFRASPERLSIYEEMGVDLVTLANNHVYDFGRDAFYDMLDSFREYKIPYIGAGKNIEEAKEAYYFILNGYKISFVNATRAEKLVLTPEATESDGGVFRCYDASHFVEVIEREKKVSDYVVALVHYGREDSHSLEDVQVTSSKMYIDAGADVIVGSHAHVLQGIEFYNDKPIIYNLGDFIFNHETKETGIFQIKLNDDGSMKYYFIPALEDNKYTKLLDGDDRNRVISHMNSWSVNAVINSEGEILEK